MKRQDKRRYKKGEYILFPNNIGEINMHRETTAIYPNRIRDKKEIETELGLPEYGYGVDVDFITHEGYKIAVGYTRVVYGDHGPYIEMTESQLCLESLNLKSKSKREFYNKWYTPDRVLVYEQLRDVKHLPNPPKDGKKEAFRGNRKEGYADYRVGMFYVDPRLIKTHIKEEICK